MGALTIVQNTHTRLSLVEARLIALNKDRSFFQIRLQEVKRIKKRSQIILEDSVDEVVVNDLLDSILGIIEDLNTYIKHLDEEILKVERGLTTLKYYPVDELSEAFVDYILEDTRLSIKNTAITRYDYDQLIFSLREIEKSLLS